MTIWDDTVSDPRPGASDAVTATAAALAAIAWAYVIAVRAGTTFGLVSLPVLLVGGWIIGILIVSTGLILGLTSLTRVLRDNAQGVAASRAHFWVALLLVVSWPLWMVFTLTTILDW